MVLEIEDGKIGEPVQENVSVCQNRECFAYKAGLAINAKSKKTGDTFVIVPTKCPICGGKVTIESASDYE